MKAFTVSLRVALDDVFTWVGAPCETETNPNHSELRPSHETLASLSGSRQDLHGPPGFTVLVDLVVEGPVRTRPAGACGDEDYKSVSR